MIAPVGWCFLWAEDILNSVGYGLASSIDLHNDAEFADIGVCLAGWVEMVSPVVHVCDGMSGGSHHWSVCFVFIPSVKTSCEICTSTLRNCTFSRGFAKMSLRLV